MIQHKRYVRMNGEDVPVFDHLSKTLRLHDPDRIEITLATVSSLIAFRITPGSPDDLLLSDQDVVELDRGDDFETVRFNTGATYSLDNGLESFQDRPQSSIASLALRAALPSEQALGTHAPEPLRLEFSITHDEGELEKPERTSVRIAPNIFKRDGINGPWVIRFQGQDVKTKDRSGFAYIAQLLGQRPEDRKHGIDVETLSHNKDLPPPEMLRESKADQGPHACVSRKHKQILEPYGADKLRQYRRDYAVELECCDDHGRREKLNDLIAGIDEQLQKNSPAGRSPRTFSDESSKTYNRVTKEIRRAREALGKSDTGKPLADHLSKTIEPGAVCKYTGDLEWET